MKLRPTLVALLATLTVACGLSVGPGPFRTAATAGASSAAAVGLTDAAAGLAAPGRLPQGPRKPHALTTRLVLDDHYAQRHGQQPLVTGTAIVVPPGSGPRRPGGSAVAGNLAGGAARPFSRAPPALL